MRKKTVNLGPSWLGLVGIIFVVAKVFEIGPVAEWSWWLVLLPFYLGFGIVVGVMLVGGGTMLLLASLISLIESYQAAKLNKYRIRSRTKKNGDDFDVHP